jgi:hypothetical protein
MTRYVAIVGDDEPATFDTAGEAWAYLLEERKRHEDETADDDAPEGYSKTVEELEKRARWAASGLVADFETVGTICGPTPWNDNDHDLGLAYSVTEAE